MTREELLAAIKRADHEYYDLDAPTMSDAEYDALRREYLERFGGADLDYTPGAVSGDFAPFHHPEPITSLAKVKAGEDAKLLAAIAKLWPVCLEPKLDGLTVVAYPDADGACRFVTRGNGRDGELLPNFISRYEKGPVNTTGYAVRGEVFLRRADFAAIVADQQARGEEPFRQIRNAAAGILRSKTRSPYLDRLSYIVYDLVGADLPESDKLERLRRGTKFPAVDARQYATPEAAAANVASLYDAIMAAGELPCDGMVIKSERPGSLAEFGSTNHHPNNAVAWKPVTDKFSTELLGVAWQVGRWRVTPVAKVAPVLIDGTTVTQASLANVGVIRSLGLRMGAAVTIHKSNEIIPQIIDAVGGEAPVEVPAVCPSCGAPLRLTNEQLFCDNPVCPEKLAQRLRYLGSKNVLDIDGLSIETSRKIVAAFPSLVNERRELAVFALALPDLAALPGFKEKSAQRLFDGIQRSREGVDLAHFVAACGANGIGLAAGNILMARYGTYEALLAAVRPAGDGGDDLTALDGIGETLAAALQSGEFRASCVALREFIAPVVVERSAGDGNAKRLVFVLTGKMAQPRDVYASRIKAAGHSVASSVSARTDYLVIADPASQSAKARRARELGVRLIAPESLGAALGEK